MTKMHDSQHPIFDVDDENVREDRDVQESSKVKPEIPTVRSNNKRALVIHLLLSVIGLASVLILQNMTLIGLSDHLFQLTFLIPIFGGSLIYILCGYRFLRPTGEKVYRSVIWVAIVSATPSLSLLLLGAVSLFTTLQPDGPMETILSLPFVLMVFLNTLGMGIAMFGGWPLFLINSEAFTIFLQLLIAILPSGLLYLGAVLRAGREKRREAEGLALTASDEEVLGEGSAEVVIQQPLPKGTIRLAPTFLITAFAFGCVISGAMTVVSAVDNMDFDTGPAQQSIVTIEARPDRDFSALPLDYTGLRPDFFAELSTLPYVRNWDYTYDMFSLAGEDLVPYTVAHSEIEFFDEGHRWTNFPLRGVSQTTLFEIEEGLITLVEGRMLNEAEIRDSAHVALISRSLADLNGLDIGSTFRLYGNAWDYRGVTHLDETFHDDEENLFAQQVYNFEVIGIYEPHAQFNTGDEWTDIQFAQESQNRLFVPNQLALNAAIFEGQAQGAEPAPNVGGEIADQFWVGNIFALNSPTYLEAFQAAVAQRAPDYRVGYSTGNLELLYDASRAQRTGALITLSVAALIAAVILGLTIMAYLREQTAIQRLVVKSNEDALVSLEKTLQKAALFAVPAFILAIPAGSAIGTIFTQEFGTNIGFSFTMLDRMGVVDYSVVEQVIRTYNPLLNSQVALASLAVFGGISLVTALAAALYSHMIKASFTTLTEDS